MPRGLGRKYPTGYTIHMVRRRKTRARSSAVAALDQAQMILGSLEEYSENHPELVDEWAAVIRSWDTEADGWAFGVATLAARDRSRNCGRT